jgi:hypothetical protein
MAEPRHAWNKNYRPLRIHAGDHCSSLTRSVIPDRSTTWQGRGTAGWVTESEMRAILRRDPDAKKCQKCW